MCKSKIFGIIGIAFLAISIFNSCNRGNTPEIDVHAKVIAKADSMAKYDPVGADSLYQYILSHSGKESSGKTKEILLRRTTLNMEQREFDTAKSCLRKYLLLSEEKDTASLLQYLSKLGEIYFLIGNYDSSKAIYTRGIQIADSYNSGEQLSAFTLNNGKSMLGLGEYAEAIKYLSEGLQMAKSQKNDTHIMVALHSLAVASSYTEDYNDAVNYSKQLIKYSEEINDQPSYADAWMNLGIYYKSMGMPDSAIEAYNKASNVFRELNDSLKLVMTRYNVGNILKNQKKYKEAEQVMKEIFEYCASNGIPEGQAYSLWALSAIYEETGRVNDGLALIDTAIKIASHYNLINKVKLFHEKRHSLLYSLGRYQEAYQSSLQAGIIYDSLLGLEKQREILELKTKYETEEKAQENALLKKDNEIISNQLTSQRLTFALILLSAAFVSLLLFLMYYRTNNKRKLYEEQTLRLEQENKTQLAELAASTLENKLQTEELAKLELETQIKTSQLEKIELEASLREQELVFQSLAKTELTQLLRSVKEMLAPFTLKFTRKKDQEEFSKVLSDITRDTSKDPLTEFEMLFRELHPQFYEKLLEKAPALSKSELNIAAMLRLNLNTKDIARLMNLSAATIETNRHFIRKKLNLEQGANLTTFLMAV